MIRRLVTLPRNQRRLRLEQLETRHLLTAVPFGPEIVIDTNEASDILIAMADLDGDGDLDMVGGDDGLFWYENTDGAGAFGGPQTIADVIIDETANNVRDIEVGDINGDGHVDVVASSITDSAIVWWANDGSGNFSGRRISGQSSVGASVELVDFDNDGDLDVIADGDGVDRYKNDGTGSFTTDGNIGPSIDFLDTADFDGDGTIDVVAADPTSDQISMINSAGSAALPLSDPGNVIAADLDGDGDKDVVATSAGSESLLWYENAGPGYNFFLDTPPAQVIGSGLVGAFDVKAGDLDHDGDLDLLASGKSGDLVVWYENDGGSNPSFARHDIATPDNAENVAIADIDGDGLLDIAYVSSTDNRRVWRRNEAIFSVVDTTSDESDGIYSAGELSLREAIQLANARPGADTITFDATVFSGGVDSLIRLSLGELEITETLTIDGSTGVDVLITGDANDNDFLATGTLGITDVANTLLSNANGLDDNVRVFHFSSASGDVTLQNLTITGGSAGGAGDHGGGIRFDSDGTISLLDSELRGNSMTSQFGRGGGLYTRDGFVSVANSTVSGNRTTGVSAYGGGIVGFNGGASITNSTISDNASANLGGGLFFVNGAVSIESSTVSGNTSTGSTFDRGGGGLFVQTAKLYLTSSTVSDNTSVGNGGGIWTGSGDVSLINSTVSGNISGGNGGGLYSSYSNVSMTNSTISENEAANTGGGIQLRDSRFDPTLTVLNSIIANNTDDGTAPDLTFDPDPTLTVDYSLIGATDLTISGIGNQVGTIALPVFPLLGPLTDNGGPTKTHAPVPGSPAINTGDPAAVAGQNGVAEFDQRGAEFYRVVGERIDIGSFEVQDGLTTIPTRGLVVDNTSDVFNADYRVGDLSLREAIFLANENAGSDTITFDSNVFSGGDQSLIRLSGGELEVTESVTIDGSAASEVTITGDALGNDVLIADSPVTDVRASSATLLADNSRVLSFNDAVGDDLSLRGITITGGRTSADDEPGAGILFTSTGSLTFTDSVISGNSTAGDRAHGGGLYSRLGTISLTRSTVNNNRTSGELAFGGGVVGYSGAVALTESTVSRNSTVGRFSRGGGIFTSGGSVTLTRSTVSENSTAGIQGEGGGVRTDSGSITLIDSTISGNRTTGSDAGGGGIRSDTGLVSLTNSTLSGNRTLGANADGGGVSLASGSVSLILSTVSNNTAAGEGGGLMVENGSLGSTIAIENSIVAGNTDGGSTPDLMPGSGATLTINHSLIGVADHLGLIAGNVGNITGTAADPLSGALEELADNGGPTQTHALLPHSPAINAGDSAVVAGQDGVPEFDQRGAGFIRVVGGLIDLGAFESLILPAPPGDFDSDSDIDGADFLSWQRGFGTTYDAIDLQEWTDNYRNPTAPVAAALSAPLSSPVDSPVSTLTSDSAEGTSARLIDAAMASEWMRTAEKKAANWTADTVTLQQPVTISDAEFKGTLTNPALLPNYPEALNFEAVDRDDRQEGEPWLSDDLLERLFG